MLKLLNDSLATELVCVLRYRRHHFMARGIHSQSVSQEFLDHSNEEQGHADQIAERIVQLGGAPDFAPDGLTSRSNILDDTNGSIQKYMFMLLTTNLLVALLTWIAFRWIGLENAGAWAVAAGLLHIVPYLGPGVTAAATGMAAFMQFESFSMALLVSGASLAIA